MIIYFKYENRECCRVISITNQKSNKNKYLSTNNIKYDIIIYSNKLN